MPDFNPLHWWRRFLALPNTNHTKTLLVALLVAVVSAAAVSVTAVNLKPLQVAHLQRERQARLETMIAALPGLAEILRSTGVDAVETRLVDLTTGDFARNVDAGRYDFRAAAADPASSIVVPRDADVAGIGRRAKLAPVHILSRGGRIEMIVMPIYAAGYQSIVHAYLALKDDLNTVAALTVYEHGETPGLGSRVQNPAWQELWPGKKIADETGTIRISVVRGRGSGPYEVDGIAGATRTTTSITNMLQYWLGEQGFGPFLTKLRSGEISR